MTPPNVSRTRDHSNSALTNCNFFSIWNLNKNIMKAKISDWSNLVLTKWYVLEIPGIEPGTFRMQSGCATTVPYPHIHLVRNYIYILIYWLVSTRWEKEMFVTSTRREQATSSKMCNPRSESHRVGIHSTHSIQKASTVFESPGTIRRLSWCDAWDAKMWCVSCSGISMPMLPLSNTQRIEDCRRRR